MTLKKKRFYSQDVINNLTEEKKREFIVQEDLIKKNRFIYKCQRIKSSSSDSVWYLTAAAANNNDRFVYLFCIISPHNKLFLQDGHEPSIGII